MNLKTENDSFILDNSDIKELNNFLPIENFDFEDFELLKSID
jgi:hypothetical protein